MQLLCGFIPEELYREENHGFQPLTVEGDGLLHTLGSHDLEPRPKVTYQGRGEADREEEAHMAPKDSRDLPVDSFYGLVVIVVHLKMIHSGGTKLGIIMHEWDRGPDPAPTGGKHDGGPSIFGW